MFLKKHINTYLPTVKWGEFSVNMAISIREMREHQQKTFVTFCLADFGG